MDPEFEGWRPSLAADGGPLYAQIADAIERAVEAGELRPGDRLPPQRALAKALSVDFTTVTRAYTEARRRNLLDAVTGRGSFIAARKGREGPAVDLSMNVPPAPRGVSLAELIGRGVNEILARSNADVLMSYHSGPGAASDLAAAAVWLKPRLGPVAPERIAIAPGAQGALAAILSLAAAPGETVLADALTYPGLLSAADRLGLTVAGLEGDGQGLRPDALEQAIGAHRARLLYLTPTISNPTAITIPETRRREIARICVANGVAIVEDDPYAPLADDAPPAFAELAPASTWHVATVSKTLTPGLRTAYVVPPDAGSREAFVRASRALALMPAPLMTALLTFWIRDGAAADILAGVREEAAARQRLARETLPETAQAHVNGLHVWLPLPARWERYRLIETARAEGLGVTPSDAFVASGPAPDAVRISLGAVPERPKLAAALRTLAGIVGQDRPRLHEVV